MTDTSTDSDASAEGGEGTEINADVGSLAIDGTDPSVGDHVEVKAAGTVSKVVNGIATITVETVNGTPMPASPSVAEPAPAPGPDIGAMAAMADSQKSY